MASMSISRKRRQRRAAKLRTRRRCGRSRSRTRCRRQRGGSDPETKYMNAVEVGDLEPGSVDSVPTVKYVRPSPNAEEA